jgi:drug/metabolite transporter (DMT)-like permease
VAIVLGLAVALVYGTADFLGGYTARGNRSIVVVAVSQVTGLALTVLLVAVDGTPAPGLRALGLGAASGAAGLVGVTLLYRGLAAGAMGVIAPITAVGAAVVPVAYGLATGDRPSVWAYVGIVLALVAVAVIASHVDRSPARHDPAGAGEVLLAVAAGVGFGVALVFLSESGESDGFWPVLAARAASAPLAFAAVLLTGLRPTLTEGTRRWVVLTGVLDVTAISLYLLATRRGLISLVAVVGSLYPAMTVLLARVVLGERLRRPQVGGLVLALVGVVLIAR